MTVHTPMTPMKASGIQHHVARVYREGGPYQWVRETLMNGLEAEAGRVEFGVEWQAAESLAVYRRMISDDGVGMTPEQLVRFFNTWGGGGKPIGGLHENFGIGAKSSLLPWNKYGLVVISWSDGEPSMIWVMADPHTGEYGLRNFEAVDDSGEVKIVDVVAPFEDEHHGCDWAKVAPDWITKNGHGTVVVLLGDDPQEHTMLGDPNRPIEQSLTGVSQYLNRRYWEIPKGIRVTVEELRHNDPAEWPKTRKEAGGHAGRRTHRRKIEGAKHFIEYPSPAKTAKGAIKASGSVEIGHHVAIDWFLWDGPRPQVQSYAAQNGYITALYHNELYDVTAHHSTYRSFGVLEASVRNRLWLVMRPPAVDDGHKFGVYPRGDRNSLLLRTSESVGEPLPINDWGAHFAEMMPEEIRTAIREARAGGVGTITDDTWRTRLIERFGSRWRIFKLRTSKEGDFMLDPAQAGSKPRDAVGVREEIAEAAETGPKRERITGLAGQTNVGDTPGPKVASRHRIGGGIPTWTAVRADDLGEGMLAGWAPHHPDYPEGAVLLNIEHPVLEEEIQYWQAQYPDHLGDAIAQEVIASYGEVAVAKVAHSEHLKSMLPSSTVEEDLRSEAALTMSLLGLIGEEAVIAPRVSGKFGRKKLQEEVA